VDASAAEVARRLSREGVGSVAVVDAAGTAVGIITDRDLRAKVVAVGHDPAAVDAASIMSAPLITIRPTAFAFEAALEMVRRHIRYLVVVDDGGRATGVVSSRDLLVLHATHPVTVAREIDRAVSLDALAEVALRITDLVQRLVDDGGGAHDIGHLVAELNDRLVVRVLGLTAGALEDAGETPPVPYCWLVFGSEARREQTLRTDQDNGLVYADPPSERAEAAARYYRRFAAEAIRGLVRVGFPPCPGGVMASNAQWCQPLAVWRGYFQGWMTSTSAGHVLDASIHFDLRPLAGASELAGTLTGLIRAEAPQRRGFLAMIAGDVVSRPVPLTVFGNVRTSTDPEHRGAVDVKGAGGLQLVGAARLLALQLGLAETNTVERFRAAAGRGALADDQVAEVTEAFQYLMRLRLVHQLGQLRRRETPDNYVVPRTLSHAEGLLFRDALGTVRRLQAAVRERFATDFGP
jgi:CBS domain-containing protein